MIDWLRREPADPVIDVAGRALPIAIRRHPRARRLTLRLAPDGSEARVTMPRWCATREAVSFARSRTDWLAAQLAKVPEEAQFEPRGTVPYRGETLEIDWQANRPRKPALAGDTLQAGGPADGLHNRVTRWLEGEALRLFAQDLAFYAPRAGLPVPELRLSRAQKRWGSCSGKACIRLNWRLVMAPDEVRRSVVAHEVAHLLHFDHSPAFHAALGELFEGDLKSADIWLRREGRSLYRFG